MASDFIPLTHALKARLPAAGHDTAHFAPVSGVSPQRTGGDTAFLSAAAPPPHSAANIEVKRDGDRISQIRVHCRCGELIEIDCEY
jgi:hypothetical protein